MLERTKKGNLKKVTAAQHNKLHPEKGRKAAAARKRKTTKRKTTRKTTRKKK